MSSKLSHTPFAGVASDLKKQLAQQAKEEARAKALVPKSKPKPRPAPAPTPKDDNSFFWREMAGVHRLGAGELVAPRPLPVPRPPRDDEAEAMAELADLVEGRETFDLANSDEFIEGIAQGLDRKLLRKLRKGIFSVQGHVDLHGMTRVEARDKVRAFLAESRVRRHRCVLIVHGRGLNSPDQIPVLKEGLQVWLTRGSLAKLVLAFCTARPTDGGAGAVYVLLRR